MSLAFSHRSFRFCILSILLLSVAIALLLTNSSSPEAGTLSDESPSTRISAAYGRIEMSFEANKGQTDKSVDFLARGGGYTLFLKPTEAALIALDLAETETPINPSSVQPEILVSAAQPPALTTDNRQMGENDDVYKQQSANGLGRGVYS